MTHTLRTFLVTLILALSAVPAVTAQSALKKIVDGLEDSNTGYRTIYREKRDPSTHEIIDSEMIVTFADNRLASRVIEAMKKERDNSVSYTVDNGKSTKMYRIIFDNGKGSSSSYTLYSSHSDPWTLSVKTSKRPRTK